MSLAHFLPETLQELVMLTTFHVGVVARNNPPSFDNQIMVQLPGVLGEDPESVTNWIPFGGSNIGPKDANRKQTGMHNPARLGQRVLVCFPGCNPQQPFAFSGDGIRNISGNPGNPGQVQGPYTTVA